MASRLTTATAPSTTAAHRALERAIRACQGCDLYEDRCHPVTGEGSLDARLMIVGSKPRQHEDLQGRPFAGGAGNVLDHVLHAAGLSRSDVYLTTIIKCRPAKDRAATAAEVRACASHLDAERKLVAPEVVVALGAFTTSVLLGRPVPIERVAGFRLDLDGVTLVPTYHPADAVRGVPQAAVSLRRDLAVAKAVLDGRLSTGAEAVAELRAKRPDRN